MERQERVRGTHAPVSISHDLRQAQPGPKNNRRLEKQIDNLAPQYTKGKKEEGQGNLLSLRPPPVGAWEPKKKTG